MCFSFRVSIGTFIVSWGISLYLLSKKLTKKQRQNVIFLMIFSSMQLADAVLWLIKMKKNTINFVITTFIIPFILFLQLFYNLYVINGIKSMLLIPVYINCLIGIFFNYMFNDSRYGYSRASSNMFSSPIWGWDTKPLAIIIFLFLITYGRIGFSGEKLHLIIGGFLTLLISFLLGGGYGSIWCAFANLLSIYYLYKY